MDTTSCNWLIGHVRDMQKVPNIAGSKKFANFLATIGWTCGSSAYANNMTHPLRRHVYTVLAADIDQAGYKCAVFRVHGQEFNYAYAYWSQGNMNANPDMVCVCPTYMSMDGEYRSGIMYYVAFSEQYAKLDPEYEQHVKSMIVDVGIEVHGYMPACSKDKIDLLSLKLLTAYMSTMIMMGSVGYMSHIRASQIEYVRHIPFKIDITTSNYRFDSIKSNGVTIASLGQKIVPLHRLAVTNVEDPVYQVWRETKAMNMVSDITCNLLSSSFPYYCGWTYIMNADQYLYENKPMLDKYARSAVACAAEENLRKGQQLIESDHQNVPGQKMDAKIAEAIRFARAELELASVAILHFMEDVGVTCSSIPTVYNSSIMVPHGFIDMVKNPDIGAHALFTIAHALHTMHERCKIVHGDIHTNNMTLQISRTAATLWGVYDKVNRRTATAGSFEVSDPVSVYIAGHDGERDAFIFPSRLVQPKIIDFSRAIFGEMDGHEASIDQFWVDQDERVSHMVELPIALVTQNRSAVFDALRFADIVAAAKAFKQMYAEFDDLYECNENSSLCKDDSPMGGKCVACKPTIQLCETLEAAAYASYTSQLENIRSGGSKATKYVAGGELLCALLKEVFGRWYAPRVSLRKSMTIVELYNTWGDMKYSTSSIERLPPWLHVDQFEDSNNPFNRYVDPANAQKFVDSLLPSVAAEQAAAKEDEVLRDM